MSVSINGFRKPGIWPVDRNVFQDVDFLPAAATNMPAEHRQSSDTDMPIDENRSSSAELPSKLDCPSATNCEIPFTLSERPI